MRELPSVEDLDSVPLRQRPSESARLAELRYVTDSEPGIRRQRWGRGFTYFDAAGKRITACQERERFKALRVPPAWTEVWICSNPNGHLQATGRDSKGRKQYRYHPKWARVRNLAKFDRILAFGRALPKLRRQLQQHLKEPGLDRCHVIATVVCLLEKTLIRVGNETYAKENQSFGLTTLRDRHLDLEHSTIQLQFCGKSGVEHDVTIHHPRVAAVLRRCQELPGQRLFQYRDERGERQTVESGDVNAYLQAVMGEDFSAKDFRTWFGTVYALQALVQMAHTYPEESCDWHIRKTVQHVAQQLRNRPATSRKYYIHPQVFSLYRNGKLPLRRLVTALHIEGSEDRTIANGSKIIHLNHKLSLDFAEKAVLELLQPSFSRAFLLPKSA